MGIVAWDERPAPQLEIATMAENENAPQA